MSKKIKPADNSSNIKNPNSSTPSTNRQFEQHQENYRKQLKANEKKISDKTTNNTVLIKE